MRKILYNIAMLIVSTISINSCITPFEPKGIKGTGNMVVIEGDIIQNDTTKVIVSRSLALSKENKVDYIKKAQVWVESETGQVYSGFETLKGGKTSYYVLTKGLDRTLKYKLCVKLYSGQQYESELLPILVSPQIDSIGCTTDFEDKTATFYVNTHDQTNSTKYYKWTFTEAWEIHSQYFSSYEYNKNFNRIDEIPLEKNRYYCWGEASSTNILVASTTNLAQDVVYRKPLVSYGPNERKISVLYSMELTQMAISRESHQYWENIRKNSDDIGGIFSPQPSETEGNIHCVSNAAEHVIGYISAGTIARKRVFFSAKDIGLYQEPPSCDLITVNDENPLPLRPLFDADYDVISYLDIPYESVWAHKNCVDCRVWGTKFKPLFWPNDNI